MLVTGATGLLGSWMVKKLLASGSRVVGLVRDHVPGSNHFYSGNHNQMIAVYGDLADIHVLERAMGEYEIDTVFHIGAQTLVGIANNNPLSTFESNIKGTWNVLEAARRSPTVKRIVSASSDKAYGVQSVLPYSEDAPLIGSHPYDVSKSCADLLCKMYFNTYRLPVCVTRCGNFFGGGDLNFNRIVPGTIKSVLDNKPVVIRSDGKMIRDYVYIEDGVEAYLQLAEKMEDLNLFGHAFNFSNENPISVVDMANKILKMMDEVDQARQRFSREKEALTSEERKLKEGISAIQKKAAEITSQIAEYEEKRKAHLPGVERRLLAQYDKTIKNREGVGLVPVKNNSCGGCHIGLPPQIVNEIQIGEKLIVCESCARIIYWPS